MQEGWSNKNGELSQVSIALKVFVELMVKKIFERKLGEVKEDKT
jgi:hypothetical protein